MDRLALIEEAADELRQRLSAAELARRLRHATSTITRRGEIMDWSARDVLALALTDDIMARAISDALLDRQVTPDRPPTITADLVAEIESTARLHQTVIEAQADGRITPLEAAQIRDAVLARHQSDAALLRDLKAMTPPSGRRP